MSDWERKGDCDQCGWCCEVISTGTFDFSANDEDWKQARGLPENGIKWLPIFDPCPKLTEEKKCSIYEDRPKRCKNFPQVPEDVVNVPCTYWFENVVTGEKVGGTRSPYPYVAE